MNNQQDYFSSFGLGNNAKKNQSNTAKRTIKRYLFHWPLFIICLILTFAAAFLYLDVVKPKYEVKASIQIKDDDKKGGDNPQAAMLQEIGLANSSEGVENEIEILKSKKLIGQVVKDLQLWVTYKQKNGLISEDLYKETPIKLVSVNSTDKLNNQTISVIVKDDKTFLLKGDDGKLKECSFDDSYTSPFGVWKLAPTKTLDQYKGSLIKMILSDPEKMTLRYQNAIDASLANKLATSVTLSVTDIVAQRGKDVLNNLILNYNLYSTNEKDQETKSTLDFLDQRIDSLSKELSTSEKGIEDFKSSKGLTDITSESQIELQNMQANDKDLNEVNVKLNVIDGIENYVNSNQNSEKAPATLGILDPALSNSIEKLSQLQLQHDKLAATMPETNPDFDPINSQIKTAKGAIRENVKNIKESLVGTKQKLESFNSKFEASIRDMPAQERQYVNIKRQQTSKEGLYTFLLQKREEVSVKYASNLANNRVVDQAYAEVPQDPSMMAYFAAFLCGIVFPVGLIHVRNSLTTRIKDINEITDVVKVPVVGELPFQNTKDQIAIKEDSLNAVSEQLRALRIKLSYLHKDKEKGRITLLTSSIPGEGKSFVSVNLGIALSFAYKKTLILELDMRKPKVTQSLSLSRDHAGMSEYLNGKASKEEIIQTSPTNPNLDIISCGSLIGNPSELLEKPELAALIASLKDEYDDIIIDSPPVHLVPDAIILSRYADTTLYIIRQGFTDKAELDFINQLIEQEQLSNVSLVFNGIERLKHGYGYKYDEKYYSNSKSSFFEPIFSDFKSRF